MSTCVNTRAPDISTVATKPHGCHQMAQQPASLHVEESLSKDAELILNLNQLFSNYEKVEAALQSNRNLESVRIQINVHGRETSGFSCRTPYLPSFVRILNALQGRESLKNLSFLWIDLAPPEHAVAICHLLWTIPSLKTLSLEYCHLSLEAARMIAEGIHKGPRSLESLSVRHCLGRNRPIMRPVDNDLCKWEFGGNWTDGMGCDEIAMLLVYATLQDSCTSLKELNLESNDLNDDATARIVHHLAEQEAPLEHLSLRGNRVRQDTGEAIAHLVVTSRTLTKVSLIRTGRLEHDSGARAAARTVVHKGLRYNFELEEFTMDTFDLEEKIRIQTYLERNRKGREVIQKERRNEWLDLLIENRDNSSALYHFLRKCPAWIYGCTG